MAFAVNVKTSLARSVRRQGKWAWLEHGTWATLWTTFGFGVLVAWPPTWVTAATLVGLSAVAAAKVLVARVHRGQMGRWALSTYLVVGGAGMVPLLLSAFSFVLPVGVAGAGFLAVYFQASRSPQRTRTLPVELTGIVLMSSAAGLAVLSAEPAAVGGAALAWGLSAVLFAPGVPRAKLLKSRTAGLRVLLLGMAGVGVAAFVLLASAGWIAWWGALGALAFVGDVSAAVLMRRVGTRRLGMTLTLRNAAVALLVGFAWKPF